MQGKVYDVFLLNQLIRKMFSSVFNAHFQPFSLLSFSLVVTSIMLFGLKNNISFDAAAVFVSRELKIKHVKKTRENIKVKRAHTTTIKIDMNLHLFETLCLFLTLK